MFAPSGATAEQTPRLVLSMGEESQHAIMSTADGVQRPDCFEPSLDVTFPGVSALPEDMIAAANYISCQASGGRHGTPPEGTCD